MLIHFSDQSSLPESDLCVIGAGPVGIALAIAAEAHGLSVLLIESGGENPNAFAAGLSHAAIKDPLRHAPMDVASCRALGGTSRWWGGRCVPFDDIDFSERPYASGTDWPLAHDEIKPCYKMAAAYLDCGKAVFSAPHPDWKPLEHVTFDRLERWVPRIDMGKRHRKTLEESSKITLLLNATVTELGLTIDGSHTESITLANETHRLQQPVKQCVLACGGLETTRLLLLSQRKHPQAVGGPTSVLGHYYMGHLFGKIADIILDDPKSAGIHDFFQDGASFARRRLILSDTIQKQEKLSNIAFWIDNPRFFDPAHKSGILSLVWLALLFPIIGKKLSSEGVRRAHIGAKPYPILRHLGNVLLSPVATMMSLVHIIKDRYLSKPPKPGFLVYNRAGRYALQYHAEQLPNASSHVYLDGECDALGVPRLAIDLRYTEDDARSVLRAHEILDDSLRAAGVGRLEYHADKGDRLAAVLKQATDGFHQIGTTRMGLNPQSSIADAECRVHGLDNLFIASSSLFPSSSQANPTFLAVAFAMRLANHLAQQRRSS
jgi:choline dehydrogenase-like flavoprotein